MLSGSVSTLGRDYVVGLNAVDCHTGESIARQQVRASRKEDLLAALDTALPEIRRRLGEPRTSIHSFNGASMLTTGLLEAFEAYTRGERNVIARGGASNVPFFQRAIELDPEFAYAHAALGLVFGTMGENVRSMAHTQRAFTLRDRVSEWERFFITAQDHDRVTGDLDKVVATCDIWIQTYPAIARPTTGWPATTSSDGRRRPGRSWRRRAASGGIIRIHVDVWAATAYGSAGRTWPARSSDSCSRRPRTACRCAGPRIGSHSSPATSAKAKDRPRLGAPDAQRGRDLCRTGRHRGPGRARRRPREWLQRAVAGAVRADSPATPRCGLRPRLSERRCSATTTAPWRARGLPWRWRRIGRLARWPRWRSREPDRSTPRGGSPMRCPPTGHTARSCSTTGCRSSADRRLCMPVTRHRRSGALRGAEAYELADTRMPLLPAFLRGEAFLAAGDGRKASAGSRSCCGTAVWWPIASSAPSRGSALAARSRAAAMQKRLGTSTRPSLNCGAVPTRRRLRFGRPASSTRRYAALGQPWSSWRGSAEATRAESGAVRRGASYAVTSGSGVALSEAPRGQAREALPEQ